MPKKKSPRRSPQIRRTLRGKQNNAPKGDKNSDEPKEVVELVGLESEVQVSYIDYAMSVIVSRALPDVRDGLKPVHRRILYAMHEMGLKHAAKYRKSATVVGAVIGRFHPHGDQAVYDSLVRMAQDFSLRYPLIDGQGNFGCFTKDTKVKLTDGRSLSFEGLIKEQKQGKRHWAFSFNIKERRVEIAEIRNPRLTRKNAALVEVELDNGTEIRCTPDHRFMLRRGEYVEAQNLRNGASLMPLYLKQYEGAQDKNMKGYEMVLQPFNRAREFVHRLADQWNLKHGVYDKSAGRIRHHIDFNKHNNNPDNIKRLQWEEHWKVHYEMASWRHKNDSEYVRKLADGRRRFIKNNLERLSQRMADRNRKLWENPEYRSLRIAAIKALWQNPTYKKFMSEHARENLKRLWQRKDFQLLLSEIKSKETKERWQDPVYRAKMQAHMARISKKIWSNPAHRAYISRIMTEQMNEPERKKKQSRISALLWKTPEYRSKYPADHFQAMAKLLWERQETREMHREKAKRQWKDSAFRKKFVAGVRRRNRVRMKQQPTYMNKLAQKAAVSLREKWKNPAYRKRVMQSRILAFTSALFSKYVKLTPDIYDSERTNNGIPRAENAAEYFGSFSNLVAQAKKYNHRVVRVRRLQTKEDVYDITVDPWHNFALGAGVFVHNSIDGDSAAAYRYCITGDSLVVTNRCLEKMDEIAVKENIEDLSLRVLSLSRKMSTASRWFDSGQHSTLKIETFRGYSLKGTYNHPILVLTQDDGGRPVLRWKLLGTIKKGDFAVINRDAETLWPEQEQNLRSFFPSGDRKFLRRKLPSFMSPSLSFVLGALVSEGYVSINEQKRSWKVGFCNTDREFIRKFQKTFRNVFPDCPIYELERPPLGYGKKRFISLEICSGYVVEFLKNLGLKEVRAKSKEIPKIIFHASKDSVASFLRGFAEGDGSVVCSSDSRTLQISLISTSETLLRQIQTFLLRFGIAAFLRFDDKKGNWTLMVRGRDDLLAFQHHIGFATRKKQAKLERLCTFNKDYHVMSKTDFIPFLSTYLREKYKKNHIKYRWKEWIERHNLDRYTKLRKYFSILSQFFDQDDLDLVRKFLRQHYLFDTISSVKSNGLENVYSLRVDSVCHSYVANGFINHNTECRLTPLAEEMLADILQNTVNFGPNYDNSTEEPQVLPAKLPNLLLNGSMGIAVGMATNIPPHNLGEVCDAIVHLIDHPKAVIDDLCGFIQGPDFPTGALIFDFEAIKSAYALGRGGIVVRAKTDIVEREKGYYQIIVHELPYVFNKTSFLTRVADLVRDKKLQDIKDIRDESGKEGTRVVFELKKGAMPQKILNQLFRLTDLQQTFHMNMVSLIDGIQPKALGLKPMLEQYIEHRKIVVLRRTEYNLEKTKQRIHILEGLKTAIDHIDAIIKLIKQSKDRETAKIKLRQQYKLTDVQADAILDMRLYQLANTDRNNVLEELKEKRKLARELKQILGQPKMVLEIIKTEIHELKEKYGDERRTKVIKAGIEKFKEEDLISDEPAVIILTQDNYIKRLLPQDFKTQVRGGKGVTGLSIKEEDRVLHLITTTAHANLLFFTTKGRVFQLKAYDIEETTRTAKGKALVNFLEIASDEKVSVILPVSDFKEYEYLVMATKHGTIKKVALDAFGSVRRSGLIALKLKSGDVLNWVKPVNKNSEIILVSAQGLSIRFKDKDLRSMGRVAAGVFGMRLKKDDIIVGMGVIPSSARKIKDEYKLLVISEQGYGKMSGIKQYRIQTRGGSGIKTAKVSDKIGNLIGTFVINTKNLPSYISGDLMLVSRMGQVIRLPLKSVPTMGRVTQGVKLMSFKQKNDKVGSFNLI